MVRLSVSSWITTNSPSDEAATSSSQYSAPLSQPLRAAYSVFSGAIPLNPRCAMTTTGAGFLMLSSFRSGRVVFHSCAVPQAVRTSIGSSGAMERTKLSYDEFCRRARRGARGAARTWQGAETLRDRALNAPKISRQGASGTGLARTSVKPSARRGQGIENPGMGIAGAEGIDELRSFFCSAFGCQDEAF